jgi:uncharacterized protein
MSSQHYVIITGASEGIGKALAIECASRGLHLILIALPSATLDDTCAFIQNKYPVSVIKYPTDLTQPQAVSAFITWLHQNKYVVNILINNVGLGSTGSFTKLSAEYYATQIQLNVYTTALLTRQIIPLLQEYNGQTYVLNMGSLSAFTPMPFKAVYAGTKAFVVAFSHSLYAEYKNSSVHISVVCPAGVDSNPALIAMHKDLKGLTKKSILQPHEVAKAAIDGMFNKKKTIIPGTVPKLIYLLQHILPAYVRNAFMYRKMKNLKDSRV